MKYVIVGAMLMLSISGGVMTAWGADSTESKECAWWYLGVLRYIMPLALGLDIVGSPECQWRYQGAPSTATLDQALDRTPHKP